VHESPFRDDGDWFDLIGTTSVVNAGRQRGPTPCCVEIDTDAGSARWASQAGVEERSFAGV
jgi:hypothetical protein